MKSKVYGSIAIATLLLIAFWLAFPELFASPNGYLFGDGVDAFKSYFNFSYHLRYGSSLKLEAVNYPYGDHLFYTNSHPFYQGVLSFPKSMLPIGKYGPAIMNLGIVFSFAVGGIFLFLILRKFSVPTWYAVLFAFIIQGSYPQFERLYGHFEMTLAYAFPVFWYLLINFFESKKKLWIAIALILWSTIMGSIGAYLVAINSVFTLALAFVLALYNKNRLKEFLPVGLMLLAISLIPLFAIKGFVSITDWIHDRPTNPWGFYVFHANLSSITYPQVQFMREIIGKLGIPHGYDAEGRAYLGAAVIFFYLTLPIFLLFRAFKKKSVSLNPFFPIRKLNPYLWSSFILLIYAMCIPFKWGLQDFVDAYPILKQFRSLGRFTWPFYYVNAVFIGVYTYILYRRFRRSNQRVLSRLLIIVVIGFSVYETAYYIRKVSNQTGFEENQLLSGRDDLYVSKLAKAGYKVSDFQAIYSLPFASTNGDKMLFMKGAENLRQAMAYSYHLGIPIIQSFSPRLSFQGALTSIQLLADPEIQKDRLKDMSDKSILIVKSGSLASQNEERLLSMATSFYKDETVQLLALDPIELKKAHQEKISELASLIQDRQIQAPTSIGNKPFYYDGFNDNRERAVSTFTGSGAFDREEGEHYIYDGILSDMGILGANEVSFWLFIDERHSDMPIAFIDVFGEGGELRESLRFSTREQHNVKGMWVRCALPLEVEAGTRYRIRLWHYHITVDDLMIRSESDDVVIAVESGFLWNNYPVLRSEIMGH
jgi:hypothetical protein